MGKSCNMLYFNQILAPLSALYLEKNKLPERSNYNTSKNLNGQTNICFFQINHRNYDTIITILRCCNNIFYLASPCIVDKVHVPHIDLVPLL
ncbi:hypothetical protein MTR_5g084050 [Medicago truncatula]|uniref:Uncharacterized protein n=1 Tax=Medicago truncatula TaxID=3880 RepID=G7KH36_MEDTR|nr:hypothetical protein MTR_5g084050 [Medicago truncatula]